MSPDWVQSFICAIGLRDIEVRDVTREYENVN